MIDAHHHLWKLSRADYGWIGTGTNPAVAPIERDYLLAEFRTLVAAHGIAGSVAVQAAPTVAETRWLLDRARASDGLIRGVVGWADLAAADAPDRLRDLAGDPLLRGIRPMLQDIADVDWILQPNLTPAIRAIEELDLAFDLLVKPPHLKAALEFLDRHPGLRAIVDHGAKPDIAGHAWQPWADDLRRVARYTSAYCKLSGLATEAGPGWKAGDLQRYVDHIFECFGSGRIVWGSDWPVMLLNANYTGWLATAKQFVAALSESAQTAIFHDNALRFYRL
ncbi:MAG TPA: amidohydrolase family protein [Burkholderiales bacterium]|nr:amidohydrolase family protein [Burkholderiales bacterium]